MKTNVVVLFGGKSVEHEVSIISAIQALSNFDKDKYDVVPVYMTKDNRMFVGKSIGNLEAYKNIPALLSKSKEVNFIRKNGSVYIAGATCSFRPYEFKVDIVFPIVHGTNVEDGTLQGYLKTLDVPFVGSDVEASSIGANKYLAKLVAKDWGVNVLDNFYFDADDDIDYDCVEKEFDYPVVVKPVNLGSSIGVSIVSNREELEEALELVFKFSSRVIIEPAITRFREINCSVRGLDGHHTQTSMCEEPVRNSNILSFKDKYESGSKTSKGMAGFDRKVPADLPTSVREKIEYYASCLFKALNCSGVVRFDFLYDMDSSNVYFNEVNTIPGSMAFYLWEPCGTSYSELIDELIACAFRRYQNDNNINYKFDNNLLNGDLLKGGKWQC